ncbi:MAG: amino acid adenylation domain-containing protein [Polyangiaceae bacterium]|nr:amino acid adenylation domain-containing protein [Polyangiaceae bacterium]
MSISSPERVAIEQERLWALEQASQGNLSRVHLLAVRIEGSLDARIFRQTINEIIRRHAAFQSAFAIIGGQLGRVADPEMTIDIEVIDLSLLPEFEWDNEILRQASEEVRRPFDLASGPLLRASLLRLNREAHVLLMTVHAIVFDEASAEILLRELAAIYESLAKGGPAVLANPSLTIGEFAGWQRGRLSEEAFAPHLAYWKERLSGEVPSLGLLTDRPRTPIRTLEGIEVSWEIPEAVARELENLGRSQGTSLFVAMLSAFYTLLHRYTEQDDLVIGTPAPGRSHPESGGVIGRFEYPLALRVDVSGDPTFRELMARVASVVADADEHRDVPFGVLLDELKPAVDPSRHPLFQAAFSFGHSIAPVASKCGLVFTVVELDNPITEVDVWLRVRSSAKGLSATLVCNADLFEVSTVERMLGHFQALVSAIADGSDRRLWDLPILGEAERRTILTDWNETRTDYPRDACIHEIFEAHAERTPDAIAAVFEGQELTYGELNRRANVLAHRLREQGVGPDVPVGIFVERSLDTLVGFLGILKAGGAYVPLDPEYPVERLQLMLEDSRASVLLARPAEASKLSFKGRILDIAAGSGGAAGNQASHANASGIAYVMFTSGSTGRPKGVAVTHRGVVRLVVRTNYIDVVPSDRVLHASNLSFDASTFEIWSALLNGARLVIMKHDTLLSPREFSERVRADGVSVMLLPTALFHQMASAVPEVFGGLRYVLFGGDACDPKRVREVLEKAPPQRLINAYGPTENAVIATCHVVQEVAPDATSVPIGRPIANTQVYILDRRLEPVPIGVPGELCVAGDGLARGYINRPELTAESFVQSPFSAAPDARLYRTGDRVRYLADGTIEFLGRVDHQIKLRGFRVELAEIEAALSACPGVCDASVSVWEKAPSDKRLVAYVSPANDARLSAADIRSFLQGKLPAFMIPAEYVMLSRLPVTPAGKVDRKALPPPTIGRPEASTSYVAPRNSVEETLSRIFSEAFQVSQVGVHDHFLELGGHSLLAIQILSKVRESYGVSLPLRALFEAPTVEGLARALGAARADETRLRTPPIKRISRDRPIPLSFPQQQLWLLVQVAPNVPFYNEPATVYIPGRLDEDALERALKELITRHESLRTTFTGMKARPLYSIIPSSSRPAPSMAPVSTLPTQVIAPFSLFTLAKLDLSGLSEAAREDQARRIATAEARKPFDLTNGPLIRATLVRFGDEEHRLYLTMYHIITDGVSLHIFLKELSALYLAFSAGKPSPLPELPLQYVDFALWQRRTHTVEALDPQISYWQRKLEGIPLLALPTDKPRPAVQTFFGAKYSCKLRKELWDAVKALSRSEGVTIFMTLLAVFQTLLHRYTGQDDIVVGTVSAGRSRVELENIIGFFVNPIVLRTDFAGNPTVKQILSRVREVTLEAFAHEEVPFEMLVEQLRVPRTRSHNPLFQVAFVLEPPLGQVETGWTLSQQDVDTGTSKFDLTLHIDERADGAIVRFEYDKSLFETTTIARMAAHFENLLEATVADPTTRIADLPLLTAEELRKLIESRQPRESFPSDACLHEVFEAQVARAPRAGAVYCDGMSRSYQQLDVQANQVANYLRKLGVGPDTMVGLCMERSVGMLVAMLGILKAGGAYVPLDPNYPSARLSYMLEDTGTSVILTERRLVERIPNSKATIVSMDADWERIAKESSEKPASGVTPDNLAYVIYTSGSTGKPKGVMLPHRNVVRLFRSTEEWFHFDDKDVWTMFHSYAFDFSVWEIWGALFYGGRLVIVPYSVSRSPEAFYELLCSQRVTVLNQTPSAFRQLIHIEEHEGVSPNLRLRLVIFGGEALDFQSLKPWFDRHGDESPRLINMYGITETTVHVTYRPVTKADLRQGTSSRVGIPIPDLEVHILDPYLQPVPIGVAGEIFVGGAGLARGYLNRPDLTADKFIRHPFNDASDARLYRSGDRGRYLMDGDIEYLGRIDHQVKVRGFRIELREIESILVQHHEIREALVIVREDSPGDQRIVAYLVKARRQVPTTSELRSFLREKLPDYMIPSAFVFMDSIPLTPNGKVSRKSLPAPDRNRPSLMPIFRLPSNPIEMVLLSIWTQVLKVDQIGVKDDFFSLGGHSLLAAQMIARVRERFRIDVRHSSYLLRQFLENPTISGFADVIEMIREATPSLRGRRTVAIDFFAEATIDPTITFDAPPAEPEYTTNPSAVFLTGGTGFLGAFLLLELLNRTAADIYCHVRAPDEQMAFQRLKENLVKCEIWEERFAHRIIPVPGDLSQPLLGLSPEQFAELAERIDIILHNGSFVNFLYPYTAMKASNVGGTQEIIRLATQVRMKPVHYVSSLSVLASFGFHGVKIMGEDVPVDYPNEHFMGYIESKWVAEKILMQAYAKGLPVAIYRPKDVTGHSKTGVWKTDSFACSFLKALIDLDCAPDIPIPLDYVPVDYVSKAIVHIATKQIPTGKAYHLNNTRYQLLSAIIERMQAFGYPVRKMPYLNWVQEIVLHTGKNPTSPLTPFVPLFVERWSEENLTYLEIYFEGKIPRFTCENTLEALRGTDIACPPIDDELLSTYLNYFLRVGFLPPPPAREHTQEVAVAR